MTLERLHKDMVTAWKSGDLNRKKVLSDTIAHIKRAAIDKGCRDDIKEDFVDAELQTDGIGGPRKNTAKCTKQKTRRVDIIDNSETDASNEATNTL